MKIIDANDLKRIIEDRIDYIPSNDYDEGWNAALNTVIDEIENAPTIEPQGDIVEAIKTIKAICTSHNDCISCPMNQNCNNYPGKWEEPKGGTE